MALIFYQPLFLLTLIHSVILSCMFYYVCMWAYIPWMLIYSNSLRTGLNVIFFQGICHCFSQRTNHVTKIKLNYWLECVETIKVYNSDINSQDGLLTFPPATLRLEMEKIYWCQCYPFPHMQSRTWTNLILVTSGGTFWSLTLFNGSPIGFPSSPLFCGNREVKS